MGSNGKNKGKHDKGGGAGRAQAPPAKRADIAAFAPQVPAKAPAKAAVAAAKVAPLPAPAKVEQKVAPVLPVAPVAPVAPAAPVAPVPQKGAAWGEPFARFEARWTWFESRLITGVLLSQLAALVSWVFLNGLSESVAQSAGVVFRAVMIAIAFGLGTWFGFRKMVLERRRALTLVAIALGLCLAPAWREAVLAATRPGASATVIGLAQLDKASAGYFDNVKGWLQEGSTLTLMGGLRGLADAQPERPPPLAHERFAAIYAGLTEATGPAAAGRADDLAVRRLAERHPAAAELVPWLTAFEAHLRKIFWVDRALAWQLWQTELAVSGAELRLPFESFALVFTDRLALSLAERLVAVNHPKSPAAGHFAHVVTVYVSGGSGGVHLRIAVDPLGGDPPQVVEHTIRLDAPIRGVPGDQIPAPLPGLVHLVVSAILYATSPGATPSPRKAPPTPRKAGSPQQAYTSDQVWHLPGVIEIRQLRGLLELERAPGGRALLHRHMVRGHWRRANPGWKDQALRWVEPHWKGPELGPIVERAYRLAP